MPSQFKFQAPKTSILIVGSNGNLGRRLYKAAKKSKLYNVIGLSRSKSEFVDIVADASKLSNINSCLERFKPEIIINTAAITNVDMCELSMNNSFNINAGIPINIVRSLDNLKLESKLIHISTDQVYMSSPYSDIGDECPINNYSKTKLSGDLETLKYKKSIVLRTNFLFESQIKWLLSKCKSNEDFFLFNDVLFNPVHIDFLVGFIFKVIHMNIYGVFNLGSKDGISKAETYLELAKYFKIDMLKANLISIDSANLKAPRPKDMTMNISRLEEAFSISLPSITTTIKQLFLSYN